MSKDSKRRVRSVINKRLAMIDNKLTTGSHLAELEALKRAADDAGIELPEWALFYRRLLWAAVRRGWLMPPVNHVDE